MPAYNPANTASAAGAIVVVPSDTAQFMAVCRGLYVGTGGNVTGLMQDGTTATFLNVPTGTVLPVAFARVNATATTAAGMLALY